MITAIIIDDEVHVRETIIHMLNIYCPNVKVIGQAHSVESGYKIIKDQNPDVVFLDVKMHDGTGYDLINKFSKVNFRFIIITAHEEFAIQAFKVNAVDYILKPVDPTDLMNAVVKISNVLNNNETRDKPQQMTSNSINLKNETQKLVLKTIDNVFIVEIDEIIRCESQNNYTLFFIKDGSTIKVSKTLKEYEETLLPYSFIRCHQTHLINPKYISKYIKHPNLQLIMINGQNIPVSVRKKELVESLINKMKDQLI